MADKNPRSKSAKKTAQSSLKEKRAQKREASADDVKSRKR